MVEHSPQILASEEKTTTTQKSLSTMASLFPKRELSYLPNILLWVILIVK